MPKTLTLYGATGQTGSLVLPMALEAGLRVRCYVRSPDKLLAEHRNHDQVEVLQGDFENPGCVRAAVEGADHVICVGGGPATFKPGLMQNTVKAIVKGMRDHGVKRLIFQSGAFSPAPGTQNPLFVRVFLRPLLGRIFGIRGMFAENDAIMAYLDADAKDLDWTCTRPGQIEDKPSKGELKTSDTMSGPCTFVDLARLNLKLAQGGDHLRSCPYVNY